MTVEEIIKNRGITRVLHFTTTSGLLGILATRAVKSRARLRKEEYLEFIYRPNCRVRYDPDWLDYVNLSIQTINAIFFRICANKWHRDRQWCVLSFVPGILAHEGVVFATTNNSYRGVQRGTGPSGLRALYAASMGQCHRWVSGFERPSGLAPNVPSCPQAEVLYPRELSLDSLDKVFLSTDEQTDLLAGQIAALGCPKIDYEVDTSVFT